MSTASMVIFSNPLFASYSIYARNASLIRHYSISSSVVRCWNAVNTWNRCCCNYLFRMPWTKSC